MRKRRNADRPSICAPVPVRLDCRQGPVGPPAHPDRQGSQGQPAQVSRCTAKMNEATKQGAARNCVMRPSRSLRRCPHRPRKSGTASALATPRHCAPAPVRLARRPEEMEPPGGPDQPGPQGQPAQVGRCTAEMSTATLQGAELAQTKKCRPAQHLSDPPRATAHLFLSAFNAGKGRCSRLATRTGLDHRDSLHSSTSAPKK